MPETDTEGRPEPVVPPGGPVNPPTSPDPEPTPTPDPETPTPDEPSGPDTGSGDVSIP